MKGELTINEKEILKLVAGFLRDGVFRYTGENSSAEHPIRIESLHMAQYRNEIEVHFTDDPKPPEIQKEIEESEEKPCPINAPSASKI